MASNQITPLRVRRGTNGHRTTATLTLAEYNQLEEMAATLKVTRSDVTRWSLAVFADCYYRYLKNPNDTDNPLRDFFQGNMQ